MKNRILKKFAVIPVRILVFTFALAGCGQCIGAGCLCNRAGNTFRDDGEPFILHLYDNETAETITLK